MLISKAALKDLGLLNRKHEIVDVPEWGEGSQVKVIELSALDRTKVFLDMHEKDGEKGKKKRKKKSSDMIDSTYQVLAKCLVDEGDEPLFSYEELCIIKGEQAMVVDRLVQAAMRVNGLLASEEQVKNSEPSPGDSSPSASA